MMNTPLAVKLFINFNYKFQGDDKFNSANTNYSVWFSKVDGGDGNAFIHYKINFQYIYIRNCL